MKKSILLLIALFLLSGTISFAQQKNTSGNLKGNGEVFFYEDFDWSNPDDPRGYTLPDGYYLEDPDDTGYNWQWIANDSIIAEFTSEPPFQSTSKVNGHLALELNKYNNFKDPRTVVNNSIVFPTFDFSDKSSVVLRFEQHFMNGGDGANEVHVSSDAGVHWAVFDCGFGTLHKDRPNDAAPGQPVVYEANISEVAAGAPEVIIKIHWGETTLYFWVIDDFTLSEAYDNDLQLKHFKLEWDDGIEETEESFMHDIPISQVGGSFTNFQSSVSNFGEMDQDNVTYTVDITKNNESVFQGTAENSWLSPLILDTMNVEGAYTPTEFGHYAINYEFTQDQEEQTPADNSKKIFFNVTDSVYSRSDESAELSWAYGFEHYGGDEGELGWNIDHFVGVKYPIYGDCEVNSISCFITGGLADGKIEFWYTLWWVPEEGEAPIEWMSTEVVELDSALFNTWVTLPFDKDGETEFLLAGDHVIAGISYNNYNDDPLVRRSKNLEIGHDASIKVNDLITTGHHNDSWVESDFVRKRNIMVRLNLNDQSNIIDGVDLSNAFNTLEQNYPNPFSGHTQIQYDLVDNNMVSIEVKDLAGRQVMLINEGNKSAGYHTCNIDGSQLEAGVYFYTLKAGAFVQTKRMIVAD